MFLSRKIFDKNIIDHVLRPKMFDKNMFCNCLRPNIFGKIMFGNWFKAEYLVYHNSTYFVM